MSKVLDTIKVQKRKTIACSGYNPFQTGNGEWRDKSKERAFQKRQFQKTLKEASY